MPQNNKKIGIFGGSFNPVSRGHVYVARTVLNKCDVDEVWMIPCCTHNHGKELEDCEHRIKMLNIAIELEDPRIKVNDIEMRNNLSGKTKDLFDALKKEYPDYDFYFIIGQDVADNFDRFYKSDYLKSNLKFIVLSRAGINTLVKNQWYTVKPNTYIDINLTRPTSSTLARTYISKRQIQRAIGQLAIPVMSYILENNLYS